MRRIKNKFIGYSIRAFLILILIIITPIVGLIAYSTYDYYSKRMDFDTAKWIVASCGGARDYMLENLEDRYDLDKMPKAEVEALLGKSEGPNSDYKGNKYDASYCLSYGAGLGPSMDYLMINYSKDGKTGIHKIINKNI